MRARVRCGITALLLILTSSPVFALTLKEAVKTTLESNPEVQLSLDQRDAVDRELRQAKSGYLPTVDINTAIGREQSDNPTTRAAGDDSVTLTREEAAITLRQSLFNGFATRSEVDRQKSRLSSRAHSVAGTAMEIGLQAIEAYLDVLRNKQLVEIAEQNLERHKEITKQIRLRGKSGIDRRADVDQALGRLARAHANLVAAQSNLRDVHIGFLETIGVAPEGLVKPSIPKELLPSELPEAVTMAKQKHPTLKAAEADVEAAKAQHKAAKAAYFPRLDLELGATKNNDLNGIEGKDDDATAMLRLRYNLYNGGKDRARRQETAYRINEAKDIRDRTCRQVVEGIRLSWNFYRTASAQREYLDQHVDASAKARDAYLKQFQIGKRTLLDLLDSENELFQAKSSLLNSQYDELYSVYRVLASQGTLLEGLRLALPDQSNTSGVDSSSSNSETSYTSE